MTAGPHTLQGQLDIPTASLARLTQIDRHLANLRPNNGIPPAYEYWAAVQVTHTTSALSSAAA